MAKILLIEDDPLISQLIGQALTQWGYQFSPATDLEHVMPQFEAEQPDLVIIDITLPFYNGYYWLEQIRKSSQVPVIFLTSASTDSNLIMAISMGADDFLAKPIELPVLLAKIQGLLRRTYTYQAAPTNLTAGRFSLDPLSQSVSDGHQTVNLAPNELQVLSLLISNQNQVVTKATLIDQLWRDSAFIDRNALAVTVNRLRKKLAPLGLDQWIETVKGVGYRLAVHS